MTSGNELSVRNYKCGFKGPLQFDKLKKRTLSEVESYKETKKSKGDSKQKSLDTFLATGLDRKLKTAEEEFTVGEKHERTDDIYRLWKPGEIRPPPLTALPSVDDFSTLRWHDIQKQDLDLKYTIAFSKSQGDEIFRRLESEIEYLTGDYTKLKVFGKWHEIPRKQAAYGDPGLTYAFSGNCIPAKPWSPTLKYMETLLKHLTGYDFNFVLVNRYQNGNDHIGEHKDDEKDLVKGCPIASFSFGQSRDFVFRHESNKRKNLCPGITPLPPYTIVLNHGSLLLMNPPTNEKWYHSLPVRKKSLGTRINLTFRKIVNKI